MTINHPYPRSAVRYRLLLGFTLVSFAACTNSRLNRDEKRPASDNLKPALINTTPNAATPGPHHEPLQALIGDWKAVTRSQRRPDGPMETGKGKMTNFWMLNGRFVGQEYKSRAQRPKYQGLGAFGYDNIKKIYTSVWLDTTSTSIHAATGSCDESCNVFTLESVHQDPVTGNPVKCRSVTRIVSKKKYTFELFEEGSDGKMFRTLEITYTRE